MGYLRHIEYQEYNIHRLWIEFTDFKIGRALRLKYETHVQEKSFEKSSCVSCISYFDFKFYHSRGSNNIKLRAEISRLENTQLDTVTKRCKQHIADNESTITLLNVQSLHTHSKDLSTDLVLKKVAIMLCTETWMEEDNVVELNGFKFKCSNKRKQVRAGGVAIYQNKNSLLSIEKHVLHIDENVLVGTRLTLSEVGDSCAVEAIIIGGQNVS